MTTAKLYTDADGDLAVELPGSAPVLVSMRGEPAAHDRPPPLAPLSYLTTVPEGRARLYIEHGCSLDDYETDRAIWAAEYVRVLANRGGYVRAEHAARGAQEDAHRAVLARWLAKGQS